MVHSNVTIYTPCVFYYYKGIFKSALTRLIFHVCLEKETNKFKTFPQCNLKKLDKR